MIYVTSVQGPNPGMADLNVVRLLCDLRGYESSSWKYYGAIICWVHEWILWRPRDFTKWTCLILKNCWTITQCATCWSCITKCYIITCIFSIFCFSLFFLWHTHVRYGQWHLLNGKMILFDVCFFIQLIDYQ